MSFLRRTLFNLWYYRKPPWDTGVSPPELMQFIGSHLMETDILSAAAAFEDARPWADKKPSLN